MITFSGCNVVPIEMAEEFQHAGHQASSRSSAGGTRERSTIESRRWQKACRISADLVLDTGAPPGDAMVKIEGLDTPVVARLDHRRMSAGQRDQSRSRASA